MPEPAAGSPTDRNGAPPRPRRPWPLSWIVIAILAYILLQTAYFLFRA
jgi:hypothetical protein